jgi:membrane associated rhomboid family serine protease
MTGLQKKYTIKPRSGDNKNALLLLIAVCLIGFLVIIFLRAVWFYKFPKTEAATYFNRDVISLIAMPAGIKDFLHKPWTLITHPFADDNFWHIFANMLWLWGFGFILQDLAGSRRIIPLFLYGSWIGAIVFLAVMNLLPNLQDSIAGTELFGASAGVMAVVIAATTLSPGYRLFPMLHGGIPLWILTAIYVIANLVSVSWTNPAWLAALVVSALTGYLYIYFLRRDRDWGLPVNVFFDWVNNLFNPDRPGRGGALKQQAFYRSKTAAYKKTSHLTQNRVDEILDKINKKGYESLSIEEKELLKRAGREDIR